MKKINLYILSFLLIGINGCMQNNSTSNSLTSSSSKKEIEIINEKWEFTSPNKKLKITNYIVNNHFEYDVTFEDKEIINRSQLGLSTNIADFSDDLNFIKYSKNEDVLVEYDTITGKKSHVETKYNEMIFSFEKYGVNFDIAMRAYDDGYAFKYYLNSSSYENATIGTEYSEFTVPEKSLMFVQSPDLNRDYFSYEETYLEVEPSRINGSLISMPLLYKTKGIYSLITEADLYGHEYIGTFLKGNSDGTLKTIPSYGANSQNLVSLPFESPWRLGMVGSLETIVESTLVEDVYGNVEYWRPDNYDSLSEEEKKIYDYEWVTPGAAAWDWLYNPSNQGDYDMHKEYLELAKEMNWKWIILDGGWTPQDPDDILGFQELVEEAHNCGIKVMVWGWAHLHMGEYDNMVKMLDLWKSRGIDGVKIDYFDGNEQQTAERVESQNTLIITERLYQECAKRQMVVNCHGCNKPTGERRIYPHVINREAVRGNEMKNNVSEFLTTIPFIRGTIGPTDYTPTLLPMNENVTVGHQLALHTLLETGSISMGDKLEVYRTSIAKDFLSKMPAAYDDIEFLDGEPATYCVLARKKNNDWWVAGNTIKEREITLDLSFLGAGDYDADIYLDGENYLELINKKETIDNTSTLKIKMVKNGGFAMRIMKK